MHTLVLCHCYHQPISKPLPPFSVRCNMFSRMGDPLLSWKWTSIDRKLKEKYIKSNRLLAWEQAQPNSVIKKHLLKMYDVCTSKYEKMSLIDCTSIFATIHYSNSTCLQHSNSQKLKTKVKSPSPNASSCRRGQHRTVCRDCGLRPT